MTIEKDESTWATFKRLWPHISLYKAGLAVAVVTLIINALSDTYMISLLKPLLDDGFGNADSDFLKKMPFILCGIEAVTQAFEVMLAKHVIHFAIKKWNDCEKRRYYYCQNN